MDLVTTWTMPPYSTQPSTSEWVRFRSPVTFVPGRVVSTHLGFGPRRRGRFFDFAQCSVKTMLTCMYIEA